MAGVVVYALASLSRTPSHRTEPRDGTTPEDHVVSILAPSVICPDKMSLTSQPGTSFMIAFSRSSAACWRRYASRSPSARRRGTKWMRDQTFSLCSSLRRSEVASVLDALYGGAMLKPDLSMISRASAVGSNRRPRFPLGGP